MPPVKSRNSLAALSVSERLKLIAALWDSIEQDATVSLTPAQRRELRRREADVVANPKAELGSEDVDKAVLQRLRRGCHR